MPEVSIYKASGILTSAYQRKGKEREEQQEHPQGLQSEAYSNEFSWVSVAEGTVRPL